MRTLQGIITSLKTEKTATVEVTRRWQHPLYKKSVKRSKKYACHYEGMDLAIGDEVLLAESRPLSRTKHFKIVSKIENKEV